MSIARAQLLLQQDRYDAAEAELRGALAEDPDNGDAHTLLAVCLAKAGKRQDAHAALDEAIRLRPDWAYPHFVRGHLYSDAGELEPARAAAAEALRLDPTDADAPALLAQIDALDNKWEAALDWAGRGLALDAEHAGCANLRAHALTKLRRHDEAAQAIETTLRGDPENPTSHANLGWQKLHASQPREALDHFREALRLEPGHDWARAGLVEALKARNPVYRLLLGYFLWMSTLSAGVRNGLIIGGWLGYRAVDGVAEANPAAAPWLRPLLWVYIAFVLLTWLGVPLFNLMLRLSPHGRHALDDHQRRGSNIFAAMAGATLVCGLGYLASGVETLLNATLVVGVTTLPVSGWTALAGSTRYRSVGWGVAAVAVLGLGAIGADVAAPEGSVAGGLLLAWLGATLALQLWIVFGGRGRAVSR